MIIGRFERWWGEMVEVRKWGGEENRGSEMAWLAGWTFLLVCLVV